MEKTGFLLVNQLAASIKLVEVWKGLNVENYPVYLEPNHTTGNENDRVLRPSSTRLWNQDAKLPAAKDSFSRSAAKLWNLAPTCIKNALNLNGAKKEISKYCQSFAHLTINHDTHFIFLNHKSLYLRDRNKYIHTYTHI